MTSTSSLSAVKYYMNRYQLYPRKRLGQNFLVDKNILNKIADSCELNLDSWAVEIGPGMGALTEQLAVRSRGVLAIDIDTALQPLLQETLAEFQNINFLFADILKVNLETEIVKAFNLDQIPSYQVCANIPYNITTPIIFYLLESCPHMKAATLMVQKEVAIRLLASPGGKDYGRLTLMTRYYSEIELVMHVSRNCFFPRPGVDSSVIRITPHIEKQVDVRDEKILKGLINAAFQKRRKTMLNICASYFNTSKKEIVEKLAMIGISYGNRPETLTIEEFARIADAFSSREG